VAPCCLIPCSFFFLFHVLALTCAYGVSWLGFRTFLCFLSAEIGIHFFSLFVFIVTAEELPFLADLGLLSDDGLEFFPPVFPENPFFCIEFQDNC